jgi:hypothetical protein
MQVPGTLGKHQVRRRLGVGAMGTVYEGWDPVIERLLAIKTVQLPSAPDEEMAQAIARFRREAQAAGRLTHPNIVGVFDYGETADLAYIVMEFVDGPSLKQLLDQNERFSLPTIARIMEDLLAGLQFSHDRGVVHRDIKPANVMLTKEGQSKIADFGIARIESSSMTQAGTVLGTPAYMSPEQFMGLVVDARSDIYSSGVLLYQLLTGERPFDGSMTAIMHKALNTEPPAPSQIAVTVPSAFDAVVCRAMAKRPEDRFQSASEFMAAIRDAIAASARPHNRGAQAAIVTPSRTPVPAAPPAALPLPGNPRAGAGLRRFSASPAIIGAGIAGLAVLGGIGYFLLPGTTVKPVPVAQQVRPQASSGTSPQVVAANPPAPETVPHPAQPAVLEPPVAPAVTPAPATPAVAPSPASPAATSVPAAPAAPSVASVPAAPAASSTPVAPAVTPLPAAPATTAMPAAPAVTPAPVAPPVPAAQSPLERARLDAQSLPCGVLNVADGPRVSGLAPAGQDLDRLLAHLRDIGPLTDDVTRVDRFACAPITAVSAFVRQSWESVPPAFVLRPAQREVASGARLGIDVSTTLPALYIDVFESDGSVHHLARPSRSGAATIPHAEFVPGRGTGSALIVAFGSPVALDLGARPEAERAADYLAVLRPRLQSAMTPPSADVAMVTVRPAEQILTKPGAAPPPVTPIRPAEQMVVKTPQQHSPGLRSSRCANIISRVQLGETLSDDELAALRTECRS